MVPFFSLQLLDFCLACFATLGYLAYLPDVKQWISSQVNCGIMFGYMKST